MNQLFGAAAFAVALGASDPAIATSESACQSKWDSTGAGKTGILKGKAALPYLDALRMSSKTYRLRADDSLSALEFMAVCRDNGFETMVAGL